MDTNRISIISRDLSEGSVETPETLKGFTVVKAPKGPISPILIPRGNPTLIYETLGYTSEEYPEIQEVLDFNRSFDVYVSAPYVKDSQGTNSSKVPVAYVTPAGILPAYNVVDLKGNDIDDIRVGEADVEGITNFGGDPDVLIPVGKEESLFKASEFVTEDKISALEYLPDEKKIKVNLGFELKDALDELGGDDTKLDFLEEGSFNDRKVLKAVNAANVKGTLVFDIPGEALIDLHIYNDGDSYFLVETGKTETEAICELEISTGEDFFKIERTGVHSSTDPKIDDYFSKEAIENLWKDKDFMDSVGIYWKANLDNTSIKATIYPKYVSEKTINFSLPEQKLGNVVSMTVSEKTTPTTSSTKKILGSLEEEAKNGFGQSIGFSDALADQNLIDVYIIDVFDEEDRFTATKGRTRPEIKAMSFRLSRGVRNVDDAAIEEAWEAAGDPDFDHVEVFFKPDVIKLDDETSEDSAFFTLAEKHKLSRFVVSKEIKPELVKEKQLPPLTYGKNYFVITNEFRRRSTFTKEDYWSPLVGHAASMYLACVDQRMGGVAPMYLNSGGLGGQLNVSVKRSKYKFDKDKQTLLDAANYNLIVKDQSFGVMLVGQKTAKEGELSDWSYIGHSSAFLKLMREVRDRVMIPQLGKPNNPHYRELRKDQIDAILKPRIEGTNKIWSQAIADTSTAVNTIDVLKDRKFAMVIKVKVDIFSEGVELTLINYDQGTDIV